MSTFAAIDAGTQTIRLMIAKFDPETNKLFPMYRDRKITCLGKNTSPKKNMLPDSIIRSAECIESFKKKADRFNPEKIFIAATACVRDAENKHEFLDMVFNKTGIMPEVISGNREALLTVRGIRSVINTSSAPTVFMDSGGGSTEFVLTLNNKVVTAETIPLGVLRLTEKHLKHDPPVLSEINSMQDEITMVLESGASIVSQFMNPNSGVPVLAATAGTATTLASLDLQLVSYDPDKINGHVLSLKYLEDLFQEMVSEPLIKRVQRPGLEHGRGLVIIPGTAIILAAMKQMGCCNITVSDAGLLEGIILYYAS
jgi:exopolyphosphatase/guanosine-5'-triphosphate,3'-diphosphate pyrophosphatase